MAVAFYDWRTNGDLNYTSEADYVFGDEPIIKIIWFYMFLFSQLPQFLHTVVSPLLQIDCFSKITLLEQPETIPVVA